MGGHLISYMISSAFRFIETNKQTRQKTSYRADFLVITRYAYHQFESLRTIRSFWGRRHCWLFNRYTQKKSYPAYMRTLWCVATYIKTLCNRVHIGTRAIIHKVQTSACILYINGISELKSWTRQHIYIVMKKMYVRKISSSDNSACFRYVCVYNAKNCITSVRGGLFYKKKTTIAQHILYCNINDSVPILFR